MSEAALSTADFRSYAAHHQIVRLEPVEGGLRLVWNDGHVSLFHHLWLRDNCPCQACVHPETREQMFEIDAVPNTVGPAHAEIDPDGALAIVWSGDHHRSRYQPGWLRAHCYSEAARAARRADRPRPRLWGSELTGHVPRFSGPEVLDDDAALLAWLHALRDYGLTLLKDVPVQEDTVGHVAKRIAFARRTNFGTFWNVRAVLEGNSNAYTSLGLPLHTDLPTRELEPGVQMLHCLVNQAKGGDSLLVDGFRIAATLRVEAPEDFETLATVPLDFHNTDWQSDYRAKAPVIRLGDDGEPAEIRFGTFLRGPFDVPAERMEAVYRAYRRFSRMTKEPRFQVRFRLEAGDLMAFDNRRILHARTAFEPGTGERHLRGCYIDTDELSSRIRVLERRFPPPGRPDFVC
jgi:gamma-butyrobetaine dioxygenase